MIILTGRQEQQGVTGTEQGRVAEVEPGPGERERLGQAGGRIRDSGGVAGTGGPDPVPRIPHRPMISRQQTAAASGSGGNLTPSPADRGRPQSRHALPGPRTAASAAAPGAYRSAVRNQFPRLTLRPAAAVRVRQAGGAGSRSLGLGLLYLLTLG